MEEALLVAESLQETHWNIMVHAGPHAAPAAHNRHLLRKYAGIKATVGKLIIVWHAVVIGILG